MSRVPTGKGTGSRSWTEKQRAEKREQMKLRAANTEFKRRRLAARTVPNKGHWFRIGNKSGLVVLEWPQGHIEIRADADQFKFKVCKWRDSGVEILESGTASTLALAKRASKRRLRAVISQ